MQIIFIGKEILSKPKIDDKNLRHITRGEDLYINCTVEVDTSMRYVFNWTTPQEVNKFYFSFT